MLPQAGVRCQASGYWRTPNWTRGRCTPAHAQAAVCECLAPAVLEYGHEGQVVIVAQVRWQPLVADYPRESHKADQNSARFRTLHRCRAP